MKQSRFAAAVSSFVLFCQTYHVKLISMTIYLDNNATTAVAPEVFEAMVPFLQQEYFNPSSMYPAAKPARAAVETARQTIAGHLGAEHPSELLFTSCATESINAAFFGAARANPNRKHVITTAVEHPAVLEVCKELQHEGYEVSYIGVDRKGNLNLGEFVRELRHDTLLAAVMHANSETGVVFPIDRLARIVKETNPEIMFFCDATQSVTKMPIHLTGNFRHVDMLAFSGHKIHAPKGTGGFYVRRGTRIRPFMLGGHQEFSRRGGTENVPYIAGLAKAFDIAAVSHDADRVRIEMLRNKLESAIVARVPYVEVNGAEAERMPNTLNLAVHCIEGEGILYQLSEFGICASSGSACTSGSLEPSHVLTAMGVPFTAKHGSVRISLSRYTTEAEIDTVIEAFPDIVARLRRLSPYWDQEKNQPRKG
ncbi:MAG: aminotransferase class V-fold PLP-dependent enzyme [Planctomycetaceae bacterium]|jgi:cysteine desulfurase|nr:aminotransferase class V-fold PLP-dependent enzyme [Planctomycetaceae bacterium]